MQRLAISILFSTLALAQTEDTHRIATARLGQEADKFALAAPKYVARETLQQMRYDDKKLARGPRPGQPWPPIIKREVISEYAYAAVGTQLREMRQVISVDGKAARTDENALEALALGVTSTDEATQRKMLEDFEKHGLRGVATDFAQSILLFAKGNAQKYEIQYKGAQEVNGVQFLVYSFVQLDGPEGMTIYEGDRPVKKKLKGEFWARRTDLMPMRIVLDVEHEEKNQKVRDVSTVDYALSAGGFLIPDVVVHRQYRNTFYHVEDRFVYTEYRALPSK